MANMASVSFEMSRFSVCRWISSDQPAEMDKFLNVKRGDIARDLDGDPVFLAQDAFSLRYESSVFPRSRWSRSRISRRQGGVIPAGLHFVCQGLSFPVNGELVRHHDAFRQTYSSHYLRRHRGL